MNRLLIVFLFLIVLGNNAFASIDGLEIRHAMFLEKYKVFIREDYSGNSYDNYKKDYDYYICSGVEVKNMKDHDVKANITCIFQDKWGKVLKKVNKPIFLKNGQKIRMVFRSGIIAENIKGDLISDSLAGSNLKILTFDQINNYVVGVLNLEYKKYSSVSAHVKGRLVEISCKFKIH